MTAFFKFPCPHCRKSLKVSEDLAGQSRNCPYCKKGLQIPAGQPVEESLPDIVVPASADRTRPGVIQQAQRSRRRRPQRSWFSTGRGDSASSDVSLIVSGFIGAALTIVWLAAMFPLRSYTFGQLFWDRGWVPFATTFLMFWSIGILILKWLQLRMQREAMLLDVLPAEISQEISVVSIDPFIDHINELPGSSQESFLINRVVRGIEHFRVRQSAAETVTMMESQSAIDANNVTGSFALLKVFVWSLPILGFIGTVIGVSGAVASLAGSLDAANDVSQLKGALTSVFDGLKTAFDTTLLALIMSMIVKIPASALQKSEEDLITAVDEYCNENLLRRLNDGAASRNNGAGGDPTLFREAFEAVLHTHRDELHQQLQTMNNAARSIQEAMSGVATETADIKLELSSSFNGLARGLQKLNSVLQQLGEQSIVVQQIDTEPTHRGWFGLGRRKESD